MSDTVYERAAVAKARELNLLSSQRFAADVMAARDVGRRMDAAQPEPSFRLVAAYQSALSTLERRGAAMAREKLAARPGGTEKAARLREMREKSLADRERTAAGLPAFDATEHPLLTAGEEYPVAGTSAGTRSGTGTARAGTSTDDAEALAALDPPPRSRRDVMDRLGWGTARAGAALRTYRQENHHDH